MLPDFVMTLIWPPLKFSILGVEVARDDAKLRDCVEIGNDGGAGIHVFFRVAAVHAEVVGGFPLPVDGDRSGIERSGGIKNRRSHVLHGAGADRVAGATPGCRERRSVNCARSAEPRSSGGR